MTVDSLISAVRDTDVMLPLLCSLIAGALIGLEREVLGKPAGLRTHALVSFASALMTILGLRMAEWNADLPPGTQIISDMARMPHAILTGIGFLGAGVIFRSRLSVQGLTTAASLWLTASLGIVFGSGLVELGTISTAIALIVLILMRAFRHVAPPEPVFRIELAVNASSNYDGARLGPLLADQGLRVGRPTIKLDRTTGLTHYMLLASAHSDRIQTERVVRAIQDDAPVQELIITPLENEEV